MKTTTNGMQDDKVNIFHLCKVRVLSDEKVHRSINLRKQDDYVFDIELESQVFLLWFSTKNS